MKCKKTFSTATFSACFRQKKRTINLSVLKFYSSNVSLRRTAHLLAVDLKTVARKLVFLAEQARIKHDRYLKELEASGTKLDLLQFDEMETFERSKCLPLSIPLIIDPRTRRIIGFEVAGMPAKGLLAEISRKKYGIRADERPKAAAKLFESIRSYVSEQVVIWSDENPSYPGWIKTAFQGATHTTCKGQRGGSTGYGELKKAKFDPLFAFNHTAAMIRANVSRLARRTWNTTKRPDRLAAHLWLYLHYHNTVLVG